MGFEYLTYHHYPSIPHSARNFWDCERGGEEGVECKKLVSSARLVGFFHPIPQFKPVNWPCGISDRLKSGNVYLWFIPYSKIPWRTVCRIIHSKNRSSIHLNSCNSFSSQQSMTFKKFMILNCPFRRTTLLITVPSSFSLMAQTVL